MRMFVAALSGGPRFARTASSWCGLGGRTRPTLGRVGSIRMVAVGAGRGMWGRFDKGFAYSSIG